MNLCRFKPPHVWSFVTVATGNWYNSNTYLSTSSRRGMEVKTGKEGSAMHDQSWYLAPCWGGAEFNSVPEMKQNRQEGRGKRVGIWGLGVELVGCMVYATQRPHIQRSTRCTEEVKAQVRTDDSEGVHNKGALVLRWVRTGTTPRVAGTRVMVPWFQSVVQSHPPYHTNQKRYLSVG